MKKYISLILAAVMALSLTACGGDKEEFADFSVQELMDEMLQQVTVDDPLILTEGDMLDFFGIQADTMEEFAAITCANGISAQEIVLVKAVDDVKALTVMEQLEKRMDARAAEAENYLPDEYAIIKECEVRNHGVYVAMIIHPEHEMLEELYMDHVIGAK